MLIYAGNVAATHMHLYAIVTYSPHFFFLVVVWGC